ncbi:DNA polymerase I [Cupriavidus oxalaticus]|uniref:DNA polymerase I n=1 Tax=Cupriavidus oxalaticus TaxID=96344 RepID=A0A375G1X5_9BURK|nr:DNA polymerase I [Cupriavidus oxalaticus]QRQ88303.1 DNA polymerase I [Cupriavidus oxalaticus]QRQ93370.1 DNA polymerase I [Cupriavidus oxalaticus]WQD81990.1 DNA polymerase I [Cupriavidus oxalaticus]SPC13570.1 fused DNA polymerase I 5'->3' exonuclease; 3'->5' polymerase; 3'->5' exonuclease [Cupriavidus oxalaticus]
MSDSPKTLLLVDGSSYLYRAYHALPDLRNGEGLPTGAIYGMINMLRKLRNDYPAEYSACVFDAKGKTFRDDMYPAYKEHRPSMPEDLARQIEPIHEAVRALGWPIVVVDGVEADDVIGTLSRQATEQGVRTVVSTGDKDLAQLVNDQVTLVNTMSGEVLDPPGVAAKFGVPPERIIDYLSLIGDAVDNVPGVPKVGPKTAVKWLAEHGSLDGVMAAAPGMKGVVGENLRNTLDWLPMARRLVTVKTDCDLSKSVADFHALRETGEDKDKLVDFFQRYGFKTWLREATGERLPDARAQARARAAAAPSQGGLFDAPAAAAGSAVQATEDSAPTEIRYETVTTQGVLDDWMRRIEAAPLVAIDTETDSLDPMQAQLVGISLSATPGEACYIPVAHRGPDVAGLPEHGQLSREFVLERMRAWLEDASRPKLGQNLKYDIHVFANHGVTLRGVAHDTMLQSYVLASHRNHGMDSLAERLLSLKTITYEEVCGKGAGQICFDQIDLARATEYAAEDADVTLRLHRKMMPQVEAAAGLRRVYEEIEMPVSVVLQKIERNGVLIDAERLAAQSAELGQRMLALEQSAYEAAGQPFNLGSPKQIGEILFNQMKLPVVKKTASGAPSTDEEVLQKLAEDYPLPKLLLDYRGLAKLKSTYTDKLPRMVNARTGRVHTSYGQATAVTGRLASTDPNLQNIPVRTEEGRRIREAFIAEPGSVIVSADYSQIELRIMAHISGDENLLRAFANGEDIHRATAAEIFGVARDAVSSEQRRYAKVINFGLIYGMSAFGLASNLGIEREAAKHYIDRYFMRYPGVAHYMEETRQTAREQGYVETVFGRRLWLPDINGGSGPRRQAAERAAINAPMQGTAADLIKLSMIAVQGWLERDGLQTRQIMQVHDELVLEVPEHELELVKARLPELMCTVAQLRVPLVAEVGSGANWEEAH